MHERTEIPTDPQELVRRGLELCRGGQMEEGLVLLGEAVAAPNSIELPGVCYAYLGYGTALRTRQHGEGLALCAYGVKVASRDPEVYLFLARTLLLANRRGQALGILNRGLALAPNQSDLQDLRLELGARRSPVVPFLARSNPLNYWLGRARYRARLV